MYCKLIRYKDNFFDELHIKVFEDNAEYASLTLVAYPDSNINNKFKFKFKYINKSYKTQNILKYLLDFGLATSDSEFKYIDWRLNIHQQPVYYDLTLTISAILHVL
jgi:hypothetical protein